MKLLLFLSLLHVWPGASFILPLRESQAKCYFQARVPCDYDGKSYTLGESWLSSDCMLCTCLYPIGVGCCEIIQHPIDFPDWCETHYDARTCQISVVQKSNPDLPCVHSMDHESGSADSPDPTLDNVFETRLLS
ncbi:prostate-associated microseminoprotein [Ambystoma mexicanum]|uniref:prostate-associated microseminoprotein n=1 Tax=Ambystoma mexicanum TaxID=8296 RepID=UPI0037E83896